MSKTRIDHLMHVFMFPNGNAVQVARGTGERVQLAAGESATEATALPAGTKLVEIRATHDCYVRFGGGDVTATNDEASILFLRGAQPVPVPLDDRNEPYTHVSVLRAEEDGVVQIERLY